MYECRSSCAGQGRLKRTVELVGKESKFAVDENNKKEFVEKDGDEDHAQKLLF